MFKRILVCLDGSELAEKVLPSVADEAVHTKARIILFQAVPESVIFSPGIPGMPPVPMESDSMIRQAQKAEAEARSYLEKVAAKLMQKGLAVDAVTIIGKAGQSIITYAESNGIDLIAIATHGRSGLGRAVFGSVADFVLRESKLPILMIKP
jgi:nucleotide-binding universal stress UspA family protein